MAAFFVTGEYHSLMHPDWPESLPSSFYDGLTEFNRQEYFACHETLERLWIAERRSVRELYQAVIQIAVGCFHLTVRANWVGATRKLDAGARRLQRAGATDALYGVRWSTLIEQADRLRNHLETLGLRRISEFDPALLPRIDFRLPRHF